METHGEGDREDIASSLARALSRLAEGLTALREPVVDRNAAARVRECDARLATLIDSTSVTGGNHD